MWRWRPMAARRRRPRAYGPEYPVSATNNGDRRGAGWAAGGAWMDATANAFPDWVEVAFNGSKTIDEVDVFSLQDAWANPSEPTASLTFTAYGLADFTVQVLDRDGVAGGAGRRDPQQHAGVAVADLCGGDDDEDPGAGGARPECVQPRGGNRSVCGERRRRRDRTSGRPSSGSSHPAGTATAPAPLHTAGFRTRSRRRSLERRLPSAPAPTPKRSALSATASRALQSRLRAAGGRGSVLVTAPGRVLTVSHSYVSVDGLVLDGQYGLDDLVRIANSGHFFELRNSELRRTTKDLDRHG